MEAVAQEIGKTVRYSVATWARTIRLAVLITLFGLMWWLVVL